MAFVSLLSSRVTQQSVPPALICPQGTFWDEIPLLGYSLRILP